MHSHILDKFLYNHSKKLYSLPFLTEQTDKKYMWYKLYSQHNLDILFGMMFDTFLYSLLYIHHNLDKRQNMSGNLHKKNNHCHSFLDKLSYNHHNLYILFDSLDKYHKSCSIH